ncbi:NAD-dependent protein deacetylase of SIR2 family [Candidatus Syntrophocurvum alkaliphilum]|uniref:protein acetyllysine N-acetyltransferase n=1 Tax=Candidatus Syntrophocurvum alkaliphilum TaxID=2293317 RepID=A0A6I6DK75_9FIRM|nr:Sir2 family NAD-dependent protein deacetylase [Candidatus Syntrophocurvum alkaliphilum]QGU00400.1 NAD-dependent protein deacetylase of SIR2 family [Candidatus Syntrophocurvum alkaliphilum]
MNSDLQRIIDLMKNSNNTVVVTGAGISTEAGIPDFRGENGIYRQLGEDQVMEIINIDYFRNFPDKFYSFYREHFNYPEVAPSDARYALADLEQHGYVKNIVTQNIDNLHQKAGSKNVIPIHGNAERFKCLGRRCGKLYDKQYFLDSVEQVPKCSECGSILKPDVILFGENIYSYMDAADSIMSAQLLIVIGSSLTVYPLAGFVNHFCILTQDLVIINRGSTALDHSAQVKLDTTGTTTSEILTEICNQLGIDSF